MAAEAAEGGVPTLQDLIQPIAAFDQEKVFSLCDVVLSFLIAPTSSDFQSELQKFSNENDISPAVLKSVSHGLLIFFQEAMRSGCSAADFEDKCASLGLQDLAVEAMSRLWKRRAVQVATSLMSRALTNNQLVDMDWTFGVTSASDDCDHVGKTYLQLKLTLSHGPPVLLELTLDQFYQFLASMEKCKSYLDFVVPAAFDR
eukprot:CAMPEP_0173240276 /NCGR_PEP_ID=MMETSP1142-20121109/13671_1 /TAXON_ID=483371 /ORGANISM="non described non described, Strain CCMP2298" /LENGTH=200 /DNA_ID=CAMNT_0014171369 /DNA_START=100 /DNA_END=699 /DNA_ORIENTATION=+